MPNSLFFILKKIQNVNIDRINTSLFTKLIIHKVMVTGHKSIFVFDVHNDVVDRLTLHRWYKV